VVRGLRRLGWALFALLGLALAVVLAWAASQGPDAAPRPLPAALQLPPSGPPGPLFQQMQALQRPERGVPVEGFKGAPLTCGRGEDCAVLWSRDVAAVARQLAQHTTLGDRCEAAQATFKTQGSYVEWLPERLEPAQTLPIYSGQVACQKWLIGHAIVAAAAGDEAAARRRLQQSHDWALAFLQGARSLIGHMIAYAQMNQHLQAVAAVALLQPGWAALLEPVVPPWPAEILNPARWMPVEAAFGRGSVDEIDARCHSGAALPAPAGDEPDGLWPYLWPLLCRHRLGWLPEATRQQLDLRWQARIERLQAGPQAWLDRSLQDRARRRAAGHDVTSDGWVFTWRNTLGSMLSGAGQHDSLYDAYVARPADLEMHRQVLAATLALRRAGVPVSERAAWLARHGGLPPDVWRRVGWETDGRALRWLSWADELRVDGTPSSPAVPSRIAIDPAP
jgi:hypothetical protein